MANILVVPEGHKDFAPLVQDLEPADHIFQHQAQLFDVRGRNNNFGNEHIQYRTVVPFLASTAHLLLTGHKKAPGNQHVMNTPLVFTGVANVAVSPQTSTAIIDAARALFPYRPGHFGRITKRLVVLDAANGVCYVITLRWDHRVHRDDITVTLNAFAVAADEEEEADDEDEEDELRAQFAALGV